MSRRVALTGIGVRAPGGANTKGFWQLLTSGTTATRTITLFDASAFRSQIAAECDFDPAAEGLSAQEIRRMDRTAQLAVAATREALTDSGLTESDRDPQRTGVALGSAIGATMTLDQEYAVVSDGGRTWLVDHEYVIPHLFGCFVPTALAAEVAWTVGAEGPTSLVSTGCTSGIESVAYAAQVIREGSAEVMVAGATDAPISPITVACFDAIKATSPRNDDPAHASRPFDLSRNGFVLGEGSAMFVLEDLDRARARGAHIYAELAGWAVRSNAYHMTGLRPHGAEMAAAIGAALGMAGRAPGQIDYVNAHGSGTKQNDRHETDAFKRSLGDHAYRVPISSIKSMVGHSLGAIGSIEIAACALALEYGVVPPTANLREPDPECDLDYVPLEAREVDAVNVLTVGSGFGGFQSAMVLTKVDS
ncbi:beta-ketoacyl-[acyl-carrier-protein] synthase family protein [Actinoallomurus purpureus]|uniref:beta-ketoacyl-[acyl-carrier-protein] synthase family protein n=1 Tax=Actinoallomurus purpureus TaxID=478114 RepID=UPI00209359B9|nr:beta-ketoacyl-[acyl-carrier-protein] synthase family protein [Actinoallomurus purpureus]MCO6008431.1 beta-ketoacyl-[acyl-carrier-protein] synthase family protein [Actinoallomurus purpureus]